jgi:hypothetical protein
MALANHRVRIFQNVQDMNYFIQNDANIASVVAVGSDSNGGLILVFTVA